MHSFGYHGDDGFYYHDENNGVGIDGGKFGAGDIIGCGLTYPIQGEEDTDGLIFFTKNGQFMKAFPLSYKYFKVDWFPIVGIDSFSPVEVNFGLTPFAYKDVEMNLTDHDLKDYFGNMFSHDLMGSDWFKAYESFNTTHLLRDPQTTFFSLEKRRSARRNILSCIMHVIFFSFHI